MQTRRSLRVHSNSSRPANPPAVAPGGTAKTALPVWTMYSLRASLAARLFWIAMKPWSRLRWNARKKRPASSSPVVGSMPSVYEKPRRRILVPLLSARPHEPNVGVGRDHWCAVACSGGQVGWIVLVLPGQRCSAGFESPDRLLLVVEGRAVPGLDQHADPACDEVAAAVHPGLRLFVADPDEPVHVVVVVTSEVVGPVLEPLKVAQRLLAVRGDGRAPEAELRPAQGSAAERDAGEVAHRVERDTGSSAQAWTQRSPPDRAGCRLSPGNAGRSTRPLGRRVARPNRSNSDGPNPNVTVSRAAGSPSASPVSEGGCARLSSTSPTGRPAVMSDAAAVQSRRRAESSARLPT